MRRIALTQGQFALVDDADFDWLSQWRWYYRSEGYPARHRHIDDGPGTSIIRMHTAILGIIPSGLMPDHIDRNKLNNQRSNLRLVTRSQNYRNSGLSTRNTSGFRGVSWDKAREKWDARITVNGVQIHLGRFDNLAEASMAYKAEVSKHFALLNQV